MKPYGWSPNNLGSMKKDPQGSAQAHRKAMRSRARQEARIEARREEPVDMLQYRYETESCDPGCEFCGDTRGGP